MPARAAAILRVRLDVQRDGPVFSSSIAATLLKSRVRLGSVRREWQVPAILLLLLLFFFYLLMVLFALQICTLPNPGSSRGAHKFYYWAHWKGSVRTKNTLDNVLSRKSGVLLWKLSKSKWWLVALMARVQNESGYSNSKLDPNSFKIG